MRALAALLLVAAALAGCAGNPPASPPPSDSGSGRRSVGDGGVGGNGTDPPHDTVVVFEGSLLIAGEGSQSYDVSVPANVTIVDFRIETPILGVFATLRVELSGCGAYQSPGASGGNVGEEGRVCQDATSGPATLTVTNAGFVEGSITLTGHVPKQPAGNATAAPPGP